ncbi:DNA-binding transcriptional regulator, MarR family [Goodfellowiella coeruleoviolacea]|uniref:DNA-binding transcriptional regulator, MarR family n=2 Tax=Goodfellowiella coeruleoviolacea TaxID=334858 RepID=A0AAE3G9D4_9PSEU|nr:DNA-binding transcriptional regulator, MarR family [Goodfellowiella coeruleoviolacea]
MGFALKRLQQALRARMDGALAEFGLTSPQYAVLALLAENPGISNAELARRSFVTPPTMIRIIAALAEAGLIVREDRSPASRARPVELTPEGRARLTEAAEHVQRLEDTLTAHAGPHREVIMAWLRASADDLTAHRDDTG